MFDWHYPLGAWHTYAMHNLFPTKRECAAARTLQRWLKERQTSCIGTLIVMHRNKRICTCQCKPHRQTVQDLCAHILRASNVAVRRIVFHGRAEIVARPHRTRFLHEMGVHMHRITIIRVR